MNKISLFSIVIIILSAFVFIGCTPNTAASQERALTPSLAPLVAAETISPTDTPASTTTPTLTPEPTSTETPTVTPTSTPNMVMPGTFYVGGCGSTAMSQGGQLVFCVTGVTVNSDRHMIFNVTWTLSGIPSGFTVTKRSDQGNKNMYLIDNLGNHYDHVAGGDAAYASVVVSDSAPVSGWFDFGQSPVGAFTFNFHDDDNGIVIGGISLYGGSAGQSINYKDFLLDQYPMSLSYQEELWQPSILDGTTLLLVSKTVQFCTVRELAPAQPKGEHKSSIAVGDITYEIYGYFDQGIGLFVREYLYVSGLAGGDPNLRPFFMVTIPSDTSLNCILNVSNLLSSLKPNSP